MAKKVAHKRARFERLTWLEGERQAAEPEPLSEEEEAVTVLMALGGFTCVKCGKTLSALEGYGCCGYVYCPVCGKSAGGVGDYHQDHCAHLVMRSHNAILYLEAVSSATGIDPALRTQIKKALKLTAPAGKKLLGQKVSGTPVWSEEQLAQAYGQNTRYVLQLFGASLRATYGAQELNEVLLPAALQPDLQTNQPRSSKFDEYYFCTDADMALERMRAWAQAMEEGTKHLRLQPPTHFAGLGGTATLEL